MDDSTCIDYGMKEEWSTGGDEGHSGHGDYESFEDWLQCYQETYDECGAKHSDHWDCYMLNSDCEDPFWYDCFWYDTNCELEDQTPYEKGFNSGYIDGYADAVRDTEGPEPKEMEPFQ